MVRGTGFRIQESGVRKAKAGGRILGLLLVTCHLSLVTAFGQQPQSSNAPIFSANAKFVQGVGPGYWPTAGSGLTLNIASGTAYCGAPAALVTYGGSTLTMAASQTNYVFLDPASNCAPASNTTGFSAGHIPLAKVVTGSSSITTITDARHWFVPQPIGTDSAGRAVTKHLNGMRFPDQFSGASVTAKIDAAVADIGSGPGVLVMTPTLGFGSPTNWRNDVAFLDLRQAYDPIDTITDDPDRVALVLLENRLGDMTTRPVTGTVTLANGSTAVTGSGTSFLTQLADHLGRSIKLNADSSTAWAQIASVADNTHATLTVPYPGTGGTGPASYFRTELGLVVNTQVTGGTPNTGAGGEAVGLSSIAWRTGGTRGIFGANFNTGYNTRDPKAHAVGLEIDLTNDSSADGVPGVNVEEGLRVVSAGSKRPASGIAIHKVSIGGEFVRGIWINNSYSSRGIHINGPSNHLYLVPNADDTNPMLVGRNAADSSTQWAVSNNGSAQFGTVRSGPPTASFVVEPSQNALNDSVDSFASLNSSATTALAVVHETAATTNQVSVMGLAVSRNTGASSKYMAGVEGDAYHQTAGSVLMMAGVAGYAKMTGASGTVTDMAALYANPNERTAGTVTNNYGLYVDAQAVGTNNYSVYTAGTAPAQFGGPVISGLNAVSFSSTPTFDARLGNTQKITLTGNVTSSTLSNATTGEQINFLICQDGSGSRTFAWPSNIKGGMTIGSTASKCSAQNFIFDGTNAYALSAGVANM